MKLSNSLEKDISVTTQIESSASPETLTHRGGHTPRSSGATTPDTIQNDDKDIFDTKERWEETGESSQQTQALPNYGDYTTPVFTTNDVRYGNLSNNETRCSLVTSRPAVWQVKRSALRLSTLAAGILLNEGVLNVEDLTL